LRCCCAATTAEQQAAGELEELRASLRSAEARELALGIDEGSRAMRARLPRADKALGKAGEQRELLERAADAVDTEMARIAREHFDELLSELTENHEQYRAEAASALQALGSAHAGLLRAQTATQALCGAVDPARGQALRSTPSVEELVAAGGAPALWRDAVPVARIAATDDPDDAVRGAARERIRAGEMPAA